MNWLKKLWHRYKEAEKGNCFPIRDCGLFGRKLKNPCNIDEAVIAFDYVLKPEDKERTWEWNEEKFTANLHHNIGRWIRNNWGLWDENSKLHKWFKSIGIWHADDMSGIILTTYFRKTHNLPIKFEEQIRWYIEYWEDQALTKGL